ncbi:MAG: site-specific integrase [Rhodospirillales bacterium]|nr:site-specific integrase [Rhodospirillales bacterium]
MPHPIPTDASAPPDRFGPLAAVVTFHRQEQLDALLTDDDLATLRHLLRKGTPENTLRALASDLAYLEAWCQAATGHPLPWPAPEALVLKLIAHHLYDPSEQGRDATHGMPAEVERALKGQGVLKVGGPHAPATVQRRLSSWASLHRWRGFESPTAAPRVRTALKLAIKAANRRPGRKSERAIVRTVLSDALDRCYERTLAGLRDRALLLVGFASGGRRRSEIASLKVEDVIEEAPVPADPGNPHGPKLRCYSLELGRTKTTEAEDRARVRLVGQAADALKAWLDAARIKGGPVFRRIDRWERLSDRPLSPLGVNYIVKQCLKRAGHDPRAYSAHGLRAGFLTQAAKDGVPLPEAMRQSQHRSVQQVANYYNDAEAELSQVARIMER